MHQLEEDQGFKEFLSVHQNRSQAPTWANDTAQQPTDLNTNKKKTTTDAKNKKTASDDYLNFDSDESEDEREEEEKEYDEGRLGAIRYPLTKEHYNELTYCIIFFSFTGDSKEAQKCGLSDMEYLRSKVALTKDTMERDNAEVDGEGGENYNSGAVQHTDSAYESGDRENISKAKTAVSSKDKELSKAKKAAKNEVIGLKQKSVSVITFTTQQSLSVLSYLQTEPSTEFTVKLRGVPFNVREVRPLSLYRFLGKK